jgi:uncharacterized Zn-binding protein involved in type VI secretion
MVMTQATKSSGRLVIIDEPVYTDAIPGYYSRKGPTDEGLAVQQTLSELQQRTAILEKLNHNYTRLNELQALNAQQHTQWQNTQTELERIQQQTSQAQSALDALSETSYQMEGQHDLTGQTRHVGHETSEWSVACITPDVCRVGKRTIAFDSSATLGCKTQHSPNVKARGTPVYRVGDMSSGTQANAGKHVVSGTSGGKGYVKFNSGHDSVKVNGIPVVRHDSLVQINCNAAGIGGACGQVITQIKAPNSQAKKASEAAQAPAGKRTSPRLEQLKAEREALVADMWNLDYTDKWVRFDDTHDALDTAIDGIQGEEGTAYDYAAQVGRGIAGFGKDVVLGTAELLYEGVKLSPKLYRRLYGSNGQKLTQLDVAILEEEIQLGNITSGTLGEGALEIGGAIVEPVTTPWKEGDKVEAITRGGAEVAAIVVAPGKVISKLKTRKAGQLGTDGVSIKSDGGGAVHGVDEAADTGRVRDGDVVPNRVINSPADLDPTFVRQKIAEFNSRIGTAGHEIGHSPARHGGHLTRRDMHNRSVPQPGNGGYGIDPASGTTTDAFTGNLHRAPRHATRFTSDEALVFAEMKLRQSPEYAAELARVTSSGETALSVKIPLKDIYGSNYRQHVQGVTRVGSAANPTGSRITNYTDGVVNGTYLYRNGQWQLITMFPGVKP